MSNALGGYDHDKFYDTILQYDPDSDSWEVVGHMMERRDSHAVMVMDSGDFSDYCNLTTTAVPTTKPSTTVLPTTNSPTTTVPSTTTYYNSNAGYIVLINYLFPATIDQSKQILDMLTNFSPVHHGRWSGSTRGHC